MTSSSIGSVAIVLNAHFPYVRRAGRWPHGEEALHRVIAESYLPLLRMAHELRTAGRAAPLTLSISPVALEQLADAVILKHFALWLAEWRARVAGDLQRFEAQDEAHGAYLARFYLDWIDAITQLFHQRFKRDLIGALRRLLEQPSELLLAPATYAYLPWLSPGETQTQLDVGAMSVLRHLGRRPGGLWLPGGGFPAGLRSIALEHGLRYAVGLPAEQSLVTQRNDDLPVIHPDRVLNDYIVGSHLGYPGDELYREFHRVHDASGIAYWRVTGTDVPLERKAWYDPYLAFSRAGEHARHFLRVLRARLQALRATQADPPVVVLAFDAELFGHWWFEGVHWLQHVLEGILAADDLQLIPLPAAMERLPWQPAAADASRHPIFDDPVVAPLRARLQRAGTRLQAAARQLAQATGLEEELLCQATRELLLAQSSDWATLIATGTATDYAQRRFDEHLARMERLLQYLERDEPTPDAVSYLHQIAELDNPFPFTNYRLLAG